MLYRREIDGLRALALLPVMLFHAGIFGFSGGYVGVDIFFVISGYLITTIILSELELGRFSIINFYERRARRILPALFLVIVCAIPFALLYMLPSELIAASKSLLSVLTYSSNIYFWKESGYFDHTSEFKPLLHTWSLSVEEQFYIFFPLLLMLIWQFSKRKVFLALFVIFLLSLCFSQWASSHKPLFNFFLLPTRAWELMIGALLAYYLAHTKKALLFNSYRQVLSLIGFLLISYSIVFFDKTTPFPSVYALLPTVGSALIILYALSDTLVGKILSSKILVGIGLISYSAYLWHQPVFVFARFHYDGEPDVAVYFGLIIATFGLAWLTWKFVEAPFRNKNLIGRKAIFSASISATLILALVALFGLFSSGWLSRYEKADHHLATLDTRVQGKYTRTLFEKHHLLDFKADGRKKVILIGDSYAQDLINSVAESSLMTQYQFSTFHISHKCGNIYGGEEFKGRIKAEDFAVCVASGWYENPKLITLIKQADQIWLASAWTRWQMDYLLGSIQRLEKDFSKPVIVFGTKDFGEINVRKLLSIPLNERLKSIGQASNESIFVNEHLRKNLSERQFINIYKILCPRGDGCQLFNSNDQLISYDGGHLTPYGAKELGFGLEKTFLNQQ